MSHLYPSSSTSLYGSYKTPKLNFSPPNSESNSFSKLPNIQQNESHTSIPIPVELLFKTGTYKVVDNHLIDTARKASLISEAVRIIIGNHSSSLLNSSNHIKNMLLNSNSILEDSDKLGNHLQSIKLILNTDRSHSDEKIRISDPCHDILASNVDNSWENIINKIYDLEVFKAFPLANPFPTHLLRSNFIESGPSLYPSTHSHILLILVMQKLIFLPSEIHNLLNKHNNPLKCISLLYHHSTILFKILQNLLLLSDKESSLKQLDDAINSFNQCKTIHSENYEFQLEFRVFNTFPFNIPLLFEEALIQLSDSPLQIRSFCLNSFSSPFLNSEQLFESLACTMLLSFSSEVCNVKNNIHPMIPNAKFSFEDFFSIRNTVLSELFNTTKHFTQHFLKGYVFDAWIELCESEYTLITQHQEIFIKHIFNFFHAFESTILSFIYLNTPNPFFQFFGLKEFFVKHFPQLLTLYEDSPVWKITIFGINIQNNSTIRHFQPYIPLPAFNTIHENMTKENKSENDKFLCKISTLQALGYNFISKWNNEIYCLLDEFLTINCKTFTCKKLISLWQQLKKKIEIMRANNLSYSFRYISTLDNKPNSGLSLYSICSEIYNTQFDDPLQLLENKFHSYCLIALQHSAACFKILNETQEFSLLTEKFETDNTTQPSTLYLLKTAPHYKNLQGWESFIDRYFYNISTELEFLQNEFIHDPISSYFETFLSALINHIDYSLKSFEQELNYDSHLFKNNPLPFETNLNFKPIGLEEMKRTQITFLALKIETLLTNFETAKSHIYLNQSKSKSYNSPHCIKFIQLCLFHNSQEVSNLLKILYLTLESSLVRFYQILAFDQLNSSFIQLYNDLKKHPLSNTPISKPFPHTSERVQIPSEASHYVCHLFLKASEYASFLSHHWNLKKWFLYALKLTLSECLYMIYKDILKTFPITNGLPVNQIIFDLSLIIILVNSSNALLKDTLLSDKDKKPHFKNLESNCDKLEQLVQKLLSNYPFGPIDKHLVENMIRINVPSFLMDISTIYKPLLIDNPTFRYWEQYKLQSSKSNNFDNFTSNAQINYPLLSSNSSLVSELQTFFLLNPNSNNYYKIDRKSPQSLCKTPSSTPPYSQESILPDRTGNSNDYSNDSIKSRSFHEYILPKLDGNIVGLNTVYDFTRQVESVGSFFADKVGTMQQRVTEAVKKVG